MDDGVERVRAVLLQLCRNELGIEDFCQQFERLWSFGVDRGGLSEDLSSCLQTLFNEVVWFSPFPRAEWSYPCYRDEREIRRAAEPAMILLGCGGQN